MTEDLVTFRSEIRAWLDETCPPEMRDGASDETSICWGGKSWEFTSDMQRDWLKACAERGLTVPRWPEEYGGAGLTRAQEKVWFEEMDRIDARTPLQSFGIMMLGPALLHFGTHEQKLEYLPPIARGEIRWCQGYSEPGAGSDLASVQTKGVDHGDHWKVTGQKIWTSYADRADAIFALVRTDRQAKKHLGISFLLIDMDAPGVSTRPIRLISGASPFCETFFDEVAVPKNRIVGEVDRGWDVAKYLLTHERENIGGGGQGLAGGRSLARVLADMRDAGTVADTVQLADAMRCDIDMLAVAMTMERYKDEAEAGQGAGHASAMLKYAGTELNKRRHEIIMNAAGSDGLDWEGAEGAAARSWLRTKANSIEGGTSEVMLGIIARRVLGLPA